jgi:hypothetical protein
MLYDSYKASNQHHTPDKEEINTYYKLLDCDHDGKVTL